MKYFLLMVVALNFYSCGEYEFNNPIDPSFSGNGSSGGDSSGTNEGDACTELSSIPSPSGPEVDGLAWDGTNLWVVQHNGSNNKETFKKVDIDSGNIVSSFEVDLHGFQVSGITWTSSNAFYVANNYSNGTLYKISDTGVILDEVDDLDIANGVGAYFSSDAWVGNYSNNRRLSHLNANLSTFSDHLDLDVSVVSVTLDSSYIWLASDWASLAPGAATNKIYKINPNNGTILGSCSFETNAIVWIDGSVWAAQNEQDRIVKIETSDF